MTKLQSSDGEENLPTDDEQPWRSEFNALLDRMKTLEEQCQQQHEEDDPVPKKQILSNTITDAEEQKSECTGIRRRRHSLAARLIMRRAYSAPGSSMQYQENAQWSVAGWKKLTFFMTIFIYPRVRSHSLSLNRFSLHPSQLDWLHMWL